MTFVLGQRWISDSESELGLGTVVAVDHRTVSILFTATGDNRHYTIQEAPVTRVAYQTSDTINHHDGWQLYVEDIQEVDGLLIYRGTRIDNGDHDVVMPETQLDHHIRFNKPQDRLFTGQIDRMDRFALRYQTRIQQHKEQQSELCGLLGGRLSLIPHQLYIGQEVGRRFAPRVLLSDEVGLGKTIEAGLILHHQIKSGHAQRVLIAVPDTLQHQWLVEMMRRFNLFFSIFDEERCIEADLDASNPFETEQLILVSIDLLTKKKKWFEAACDVDWDLLVVDEAHHLSWSVDAPSVAYTRIEALANQTKGVLLLTATPDQLGHESHFARLRLLDPDRFYDYDAFLADESKYEWVADTANQLVTGTQLTLEQQNNLQALLQERDISGELASLNSDDEEAKSAVRDRLLSQLLDRHGTGRVLFRNTRAGIEGFPGRKLCPAPLDMPEQYRTAIKVANSFASNQDALTRARSLLFPEQIFEQFEGEANSWHEFDSRIQWLLALLQQNKREKILIICAHASTALSLESALWHQHAIRTTVFHEGMSIIERDKAAAYFADEFDGAQVLICSEIGSEGRNFQFSHHLVLFDLPLNPDLLEQRIGRLDRIGQTQTINIHVPYFRDSAQAALFHWYHDGLNAFENICVAASQLHQTYQEQLIDSLLNQHNQTDMDDFLANVAATRHQLVKQLEHGRDRLLELNSSGRGRAEHLVDKINQVDNDTLLPTYLFKVFDVFGVNQDDKGENALVLMPSEHMLFPSFPSLPEDGTTITFDRNTALSREDIQFISWEHPMVEGVMDMIISEDMGNATVSILPNKQLPAGTLFVELVYIIDTAAPKALQIGRFLPTTPIRLLIDKKGSNLAANIAFDTLDRQLAPIKRHTANKLVSAVQPLVHELIGKADVLAEAEMHHIVNDAKQHMHQQLTIELDRLIALKAINPSVRDEEISHLRDRIAELAEHIDHARLKLDAIRLIVVSHG